MPRFSGKPIPQPIPPRSAFRLLKEPRRRAAAGAAGCTRREGEHRRPLFPREPADALRKQGAGGFRPSITHPARWNRKNRDGRLGGGQAPRSPAVWGNYKPATYRRARPPWRRSPQPAPYRSPPPGALLRAADRSAPVAPMGGRVEGCYARVVGGPAWWPPSLAYRRRPAGRREASARLRRTAWRQRRPGAGSRPAVPRRDAAARRTALPEPEAARPEPQ